MYAEWQLLRIRRALRAFHRYHRFLKDEIELFDESEGTTNLRINWRDATWDDVSGAIYEHTSVKVPQERLRQFVEGVNSKTGDKRYPVPKDESLAAITGFLSHEDVDLLSDEELHQFVPSYQAPLRLLEFLDEQPGGQRLLPTARFEGIYQTRLSQEDSVVIRELVLQNPSEDGLMQVVEVEEFYDVEGHVPGPDESREQRHEEILARESSGGWAILTPEDNILFFLKNEETGRNKYYLSLALDEMLWSKDPLAKMVLYHQDYPLQLESTDQVQSSLVDKVREGVVPNIHHYGRVSADLGESGSERA